MGRCRDVSWTKRKMSGFTSFAEIERCRIGLSTKMKDIWTILIADLRREYKEKEPSITKRIWYLQIHSHVEATMP